MSIYQKSCLAVLALLAGACTGEFEIDEPLGSGSGGGIAGGADASLGGSADGEAFFRANILPAMSSPRPKGACALCHQGANAADGPDFLGANAEANYSSLLNAPRLIGATPIQSVFYTKGAHAGDAFTPAELDLIGQWILLEAQ